MAEKPVKRDGIGRMEHEIVTLPEEIRADLIDKGG